MENQCLLLVNTTSVLDLFALFAYIAQSGNNNQTANKLQLTKAAVSKQLKTKLGVDLFSRTGQILKKG